MWHTVNAHLNYFVHLRKEFIFYSSQIYRQHILIHIVFNTYMLFTGQKDFTNVLQFQAVVKVQNSTSIHFHNFVYIQRLIGLWTITLGKQ